jgi:hypothetical protein
MIHLGFLAGSPDRCIQTAILIDGSLDKGHAKRATIRTDRILQSLWIEGIKHELDTLAALRRNAGSTASTW